MAEPRCPYFGKCGGCSAQHIDYSVQAENKRKQLADAIVAGGKAFLPQDISIVSGEDYNYRNRMDFIVFLGGLGLRAKGDFRKIIPVDSCMIADDRINILVAEINSFLAANKDADAYEPAKKRGTIMHVVIRSAIETSISFVLNEESMKISQASELIKSFSEKTSAQNVIITYAPAGSGDTTTDDFFAVKGDCMLRERLLGKEFSFSAQGFFQNNTSMAGKMHEHIRSLLMRYDTKRATLLDLYGGVGTFGINNADLFRETITVESYKGCTEQALENIKANGVQNMKAVNLDARHLRRLELRKPLFVITDPPRCGMDIKTIDTLKQSGAETIIYISCNLSQLSKEIRHLAGYEIRSAAAFDLFAQTPHTEGVVELVKI